MKKLSIFLALMIFIGASSLVAFAENDSTGEIKKDRSVSTTLTVEQTACIKASITKREDALIAGHGVYSTAVTTAYNTRKTALLAAWDKATTAERKTAVKTADRDFSSSTKSARSTWNTARRGAWKTFETDRKACKVTASSSETGSSVTDASL